MYLSFVYFVWSGLGATPAVFRDFSWFCGQVKYFQSCPNSQASHCDFGSEMSLEMSAYGQ